MPNSISSFQDALKTDLETAFPTADVYRGERVGKAVDKPKLCVFWQGSGEMPGRVQVGEAQVIVRYWPISAKVRDQAVDGIRDPAELEQAAWDLQQTLEAKQTAYGAAGIWFVRLTSVRPDYDPNEWGVEATLTMQFSNPATLP